MALRINREQTSWVRERDEASRLRLSCCQMARSSQRLIQGEVASGPGRYRRVPLDRVLVTKRDDNFVMVGLETRIEVTAPSVDRCADAFLCAFYAFAAKVGDGERPSFVLNEDEYVELQRVVEKRLMDVIAPVPADGEMVEINSEFYEGGAPPGVNPQRTFMGDSVPFWRLDE